MQKPKTRREREVWQACDELWDDLQAEGHPVEKLTGDQLKDKLIALGFKKGGQNQLYQYRATWLAARNIQSNTSVVESNTMSDPLSRAVAKVREELQTEAEEDIQQLQDTLESQQERHVSELNTLQHELDRLQQDHQALQEEHDVLSKKHIITKRALIESQIKAKSMEEKNAVLTVSLKEVKTLYDAQVAEIKTCHQEKIDQLKTHFSDNLTSQNKAYHELKDEMESQRHRMMVDIDELKVKNHQLTHQLSQFRHEQQVLLKQHEKDLHHHQEAAQRLETERNELKQTCQYIMEELNRLKQSYQVSSQARDKELALLQGKLEQTTSNMNYFKDLNERYQQQLIRIQKKPNRKKTVIQS